MQPHEQTHFVCRTTELAALEQALEAARSGHGQVRFIRGEAGSGKTTLIQEFARRAQKRWEDLVVVEAACHAQTGYGDAFAPFREILELLTGTADDDKKHRTQTAVTTQRLEGIKGTSQEILMEIGPELLSVFLPGAGFVAKVGAYVAQKSGLFTPQSPGEMLTSDIDERRIFEQYTALLRRLAAKHPLVLVVDDLQWVDQASAGLLFYLGRQLTESSVLLIGLYRPAEVELGREKDRHPLEKVINEFCRYFGDIQIDLDQAGVQEGWAFVNKLLDTERNTLGAAFRKALYEHTEGQPLFTVEMLRNLQERGSLVRNDRGEWVESAALDWATLPKKVEGVIDERVDRLTADLKKILRAASVEGQDFTAKVIAQVEEIKERQLLRQLCQEVEQQHRLVQQQADALVGPHILARFRFIHTLFQQHFYQLAGAERRLLHGEIGALLEELYNGETDEIVFQLARHFEEAGAWTKAVDYLLRAGERAQSLFAYADAIGHFQRALVCAERSPMDDAQKLRLHKSLGRLLTITGQLDLARTHLLAAQELAQAAADVETEAFICRWMARSYENDGLYDKALIWVDTGLAALGDQENAETVQLRLIAGLVHLRQGEMDMAEAEAKRALTLAQRLNELRPLARSHLLLAVAALQRGHNQESVDLARQSLKLYTSAGDISGQATANNQLANALFNMGRWSEADEAYRQASQSFQRMGDLYNRAFVENNLGEIALNQGRLDQALAHYLSALDLLEQSGESPYVVGVLHNNLGAVYIRQGDLAAARTHLDAALAQFAKSQSRDILPEIHRHLAEMARQEGNLVEAENQVQQALALAEELEAHNEIGIILRLQGELALDQDNLDEATCLRRSLAILTGLDETYQAALTWLALARLDLALDRLDAVRVDLDQCEAVFDRLDALPDLAEARRLRVELAMWV